MSEGRKILLAFLAAVVIALCGRWEAAAQAEGAEPAEVTAQADGTGLTLQSQNNAVPVFRAGETKEWRFTLINSSASEITNVTVSPQLGDTTAVWPFETTQQDYRREVGTIAANEQKEISFTFTGREDVPTARYTVSFAISADGIEEQVKKFYVNTTAKQQETEEGNDGNQADASGASADGASENASSASGGVSNGEASYSGGADSGSSSVPRVIVSGFSTDPPEVRAGQDFTLTVHLKNTSKATRVQNLLFDLSAQADDGDAQTAAFLPVSGSSSVYLEGITADGTADISIRLDARSDLIQKPYAITLAMKYEDASCAQIEASSSLSIPVKQAARFELSEFEVSPDSVEVGEEANVMCSLYNLGKIKLYNVKAVFEGACIETEEAFIGNVQSGATAAIDVMIRGKKAAKNPAKVTMTLSYEDEAGNVTESQKEFSLTVEEAQQEEVATEEALEETGGFPAAVLPAAVLLLAAGVAAAILVRKKKKRKMENEEEALLDELDRYCEDEQQ